MKGFNPTLADIEVHQQRHGLNKHPRQANCSCRVSDSWACAKDLGLNRIACPCLCHQYLINKPIEPPGSPVVTSEASARVPIPEEGIKGRGKAPGKRRKVMNYTELEFARLLDAQVKMGEITRWGYEEITLRWGELDNIQYTPDFTVHTASSPPGSPLHLLHLCFIEVKGGFIRDKDIEKFKAARNQFPFYEFQLWQKKNHQWSQLY